MRLIVFSALLGIMFGTAVSYAAEITCTETLEELASTRSYVLLVQVDSKYDRQITKFEAIKSSAIEKIDFLAKVTNIYRSSDGRISRGSMVHATYVAPCNCDENTPARIKSNDVLVLFADPPATYVTGSDTADDPRLAKHLTDVVRHLPTTLVVGVCEILPELALEMSDDASRILNEIRK